VGKVVPACQEACAISSSKPGNKAARGQKGPAHAYNIKSHRQEERLWVEHAETAYTRLVAGWNPRKSKEGAQGLRKGGATVEAAREGFVR
jgi:hypothetical protein